MEIQIIIAKFDKDNDNENTTYQNLAKATVRRYFEVLDTYMKGEERAEWLKSHLDILTNEDVCQKPQMSTYKTSKSWRCNVQPCDYS